MLQAHTQTTKHLFLALALVSSGLLSILFAVVAPAPKANALECVAHTQATQKFAYSADATKITLTTTVPSSTSCDGARTVTQTYTRDTTTGVYASESAGYRGRTGAAGTCQSTLTVKGGSLSSAVASTQKTSVNGSCPQYPQSNTTVSIDTSAIANYGYYQSLESTLNPLKNSYYQSLGTAAPCSSQGCNDSTWVEMVGSCWAKARSDAASTARLSAQGGAQYDSEQGTKDNFATCLSGRTGNKLSVARIKQEIAGASTSAVNQASTTAQEAAQQDIAKDVSEASENNDPCAGLGDAQAVRWMVCPVAQGGNKFTAFLDGLVTAVLRYDTADINKDDSMTRAMWSVFRNIALALLVIAGLVMIIAQAAGAQVLDAYTIRKALPRLLIAVVGIALSWPLMVFAVDFFNDLGGMMQNIILAPVGGAAALGTFSPTGIVEGLLQGQPIALGTVGVAVAGGLGVALGWAGIVSLLLVAGLSLLLVALLLALRWVAITICLVAAPIAIVAYVLPNTEKIWKFWSSTFIGALATFPIVMAVLALGKAAAVMVLSIG